MHKRHTPRIHRFTLIELIVVLAIIMLMAGMTFGVATSVALSKGPEGGARMLSRMLELTRQLAISENKRAALLVVAMNDGLCTNANCNLSNHVSSEFNETQQDTLAVLLRPCVIDKSNNFVRFAENSTWTIMPERVFLMLPTTGITTVNQIKISEVDGTYTGADTTTSSGICFKANGSLTTATSIQDIYIMKSTNKAGVLAKVYKVSVNWLTGKVTVEQE